MTMRGKAVLVTGAGRGIGLGIAVHLAREGARIALADVREDLLDDAGSAVAAAGGESVTLVVDVTRKSDVERMVADVVEAFGAIDVFFNNAGIIGVQRFLDLEEEEWDSVMNVNAKGVFLCGQAVGRQMVSQGSGKIVNTASIASRVGLPDSAPYAASKAAVMSLTRSMALAFAPHGVTVNALPPGIVTTDMWKLIDERRSELEGMEIGEPIRRRIRTIPLGRAAEPTDIAAVAGFLASAASDYITGQTINIDGGVILS